MSAKPMPPLAFLELERIADTNDEGMQREQLRDWEDRWVIRLKDTSGENVLALMRDYPGKYLGVGTDDLEATMREFTAFANHLGIRIELLSMPRSATSFIVYFRRRQEQAN